MRPHWTVPEPSSDHPLTVDTATAITTLQGQLDKLFDDASDVTATVIDAVAAQVQTFYTEFEEYLTNARTKLAAG